MSTFPAQVVFTVYTSSRSLLVKTYTHDTELRHDGKTTFYAGTAETRAAVSLDHFASILDSFTQHQALGGGVHDINVGATKPITTKDTLTRFPQSQAISRSKGEFHFHPIPGLLLLDIDTSWITPERSPRIWEEINGDFNNLPDLLIGFLNLQTYLLRTSSSSRVYVPTLIPPRAKGFHVYLPIADMSKAISYADAIYKRLFIAGYGFMTLCHATKGRHQILERTIMDGVVTAPERIVYVASPNVVDPVQCLPATNVIVGDGRFVEFDALTEHEESLFQSVRHTLKEQFRHVKISQDAIDHDRFVAEKLATLPPNSPPEFVQRVRQQTSKSFLVSDQYLLSSNTIIFDDDRTVSVATIMSTDIIARAQGLPTVYHECTCRDPLEPEYGKTKAKIWTDNPPTIKSFAHGERYYPLRITSDDLLSTFQKAVRDGLHISVLSHILHDCAVITIIDEVDLPSIKRAIRDAIEGKENKAVVLEVFKRARSQTISDKADVLFEGLDQIQPEPVFVANYISRERGEDLIYTGAGWWYEYQSGWRSIKGSGHVAALVDPIASNLADIYVKSAPKIRSASFRRDTVEFLETNFLARPPLPVFDNDPNILSTPGAVIDMKNAELRPKYRSDYTTQNTHIDPIPGDCPVYIRFMSNLTGNDPEFFSDLEEILVRATLLGIGKHVIFLIGPTNTGKSVLISFLMGLLGDYASMVSSEIFVRNRNTDNMRLGMTLMGKKLVISDELPSTGDLNTEMIKRISGGDRMLARQLYKEAVMIEPFCSLMMAANHYPKLPNTDAALTGRVINVHLSNQFIEPNGRVPNEAMNEFAAISNLPTLLKAELPQVLYRYLNLARFFKQQSFHVPDRFKVNLSGLDSRDIKQNWAEECLVLDENYPDVVEHWLPFADLWASFRAWASLKGHRHSVGKQELSTFLTDMKVHTAKAGDLLLRDTGKITCVNSTGLVSVGSNMLNVRKHVRVLNVLAPNQP